MLRPDGTLVVVGQSLRTGTGFDFALVRYLPDGTLDPAFGAGGKVVTDLGTADDEALALALQPDGMIVVAGMRLGTSGHDIAVARYWP